eukprot:403374369
MKIQQQVRAVPIQQHLNKKETTQQSHRSDVLETSQITVYDQQLSAKNNPKHFQIGNRMANLIHSEPQTQKRLFYQSYNDSIFKDVKMQSSNSVQNNLHSIKMDVNNSSQQIQGERLMKQRLINSNIKSDQGILSNDKFLKQISPFHTNTLINEHDFNQALQTRYLLVKKGKKLGRPVYRWVQLNKQGKLTYYLEQNSQQPQGCYSLYQTSFEVDQIQMTQVMHKTLYNLKNQQSISFNNNVQLERKLTEQNFSLKPTEMSSIEGFQIYKSQNQEKLFQILPNPKDQIFFKQPMIEILQQMFNYASKGELMEISQSIGKPQIMFKTLGTIHQMYDQNLQSENQSYRIFSLTSSPSKNELANQSQQNIKIKFTKPANRQTVPFILVDNGNFSRSQSSIQSNQSPQYKDPNLMSVGSGSPKNKPNIMIVKNDKQSSIKLQQKKIFSNSHRKKNNSSLDLHQIINHKTSSKLQEEDFENSREFSEGEEVLSERGDPENLEGTQLINLNSINQIKRLKKGAVNYKSPIGGNFPGNLFQQSNERQTYQAQTQFERRFSITSSSSNFTRTQRELCKKINFNNQVHSKELKKQRTLNQGDTDDLIDFKDEEDDFVIKNSNRILFTKNRGKRLIYDEDFDNQTILMENNPLDTFTKNFCDQESIIHQYEEMQKIDIHLNSNDTTIINQVDNYPKKGAIQISSNDQIQLLQNDKSLEELDNQQKELQQSYQSSKSQKYKRLATGYNMDSNLNSIKHDFTSLSIDAKVRVLQQNIQSSLYDNYNILGDEREDELTPHMNFNIKPINLELAQKITEFIGQNQGDNGHLNNISIQSRSQSQIGLIRKNIVIKQKVDEFFQIKQLINKMNSTEALYYGIELSWNMKFQQAKSIFKHFEEQVPQQNTEKTAKQDLRHTLHKIELKIFEVLITGKKSLIDQCMIKILDFEEKLQLAKQNWGKNKTGQEDGLVIKKKIVPNHMDNLEPPERYLDTEDLQTQFTLEMLELITTETLMFKGVLRFLSGQKFKAFMIFRDCWKIYKKYEQIFNSKLKTSDGVEKQTIGTKYEYFDGDFKSRLYLGLGLFYLGISALPKSLTTIIRIVGVTSGNRERGRIYLEKCMNDKRSRSPYAALILSLFYIDQEPKLEKVCQQLKTQLQAYPHSALFHWVSSIVSWKLAQLDDAVYFIERALSTCPRELSQQAAFLKYEIGWFHYLKLEFNISLYRFKEVLRDCLNLDLDIDEEGHLENAQQHDDYLNSSLNIEKPLSQSSNNFTENMKVHSELVKKFAMPNNSDSSPTKQKLKEELKKNQDASRKEDFVYLPHRACLTIQLAGVYVALKRDELVKHWLQTTIALANQPALTRSKLDQEMGHLANIYLNHRPVVDLLTYEIIYFLHQMPKLPNSILLQIISNITDIMKKINLNLNCADPSLYQDSPYFADYVSGMMLTIICYCFLGDSDIAMLFGQRLIKAVPLLPSHYNYLAVHSYYWAGRAFFAESDKKNAELMLNKARKYKKYEFPIENKIERVLADIKKH